MTTCPTKKRLWGGVYKQETQQYVKKVRKYLDKYTDNETTLFK